MSSSRWDRRSGSTAALHQARVLWAPSLLRRLARRRLVRALVAVVIGSGVAAGLHGEWRAATEARHEWGVSREVLVVDRPIAAGSPLAGSVSRHERPVAMIPADAVDELEPGVVASVDLERGEVVLGPRLTGSGDDLAPAGTFAVSVAIDDRALLIAPGDVVDLWLADSSLGAGRRIADAVVVVQRTDQVLTVAARATDVERIVGAGAAPMTVVRR